MRSLARRITRSGRFPGDATVAGSARSAGTRHQSPPVGAFLFHLFGAIALLVSLFLPLTDLGMALAAPGRSDDPALLRAQTGDDGPAPAPTQVIAIGDFQTALGCPTDFDPTCQVTQLSEANGIWSGTFPIPPGNYDFQIAAIGIDGQQRLYGEDGLDGNPVSLDVDDDDTGAYLAFNPRTDEVRGESVGALYTLATPDGETTLAPDGNELSAVVTAPGGEFSYQVLVNGEPLTEQQSVPLDPGRVRLIFDEDGELDDAQPLTEGALTVTRSDGATGGCVQLRGGNDVVNQSCDVDDGEDGTIILTFPQGLEPGGYELVETSTPDGAEAAGEIDVELAPGDNFVELAVGEGGDDDGADETPAADPIDGDEGDDGTPDATTETGGEPGDLIVTLLGEDGQPVGGACFELVDDGEAITESCDTAEAGDGFPDNGNTGFFGVPSGSYTLRMSETPDGIETVEERDVSVEPGGEVTETVNATGADGDVGETPESTEPAATTPADEGTGDLVVLRQDETGAAVGGACFEIVDDDGATIAPEVCDEDGDVPDDGRIGFFDVPSGTGTLRETRTPDAVESAGDQPVEIIPDGTVDQPVQTVRLTTETETAEPTEVDAETPEATATADAEPGDLIVTLQDETGQPVGSACFELVGQDGEVVADSCDTAEAGDGFPDNGNTGFFGVPSGTYTLRVASTPDTVEAPDEREVEVPAGGEETVVVAAALTETAETPTEAAGTAAPEDDGTTGTVEVAFDAAADEPVCVELNTSGGIGLTDAPAACDNGTGDASGDPGLIVLENIQEGDYQLAVTDGPAGAEEIEPQTVSVAADEQVTVTLETETAAPTEAPEEEWGSFAITVENENAEPVGGACFLITSSTTGTTYGPHCDTDIDGENNGSLVIEQVGPGDWTVEMTEESVPDGYQRPGAIETSVDPNEETPLTVTLAQAAQPATTPEPAETPSGPDSGTLTITVEDAAGGPLGGACFDVTNESGTFTFCDEDDDGTVQIEEVVLGEQTVEQTEAAAGFELAEAQTVTVTSEDVDAAVTVTNEQGAGVLPVLAIDADDNALPGACWVLDGAENDFGPLCDDGTNGGTVGDGQVQFEQVPPGDYTLREETPPEGYLPAADLQITVASGENDVVDVEHEAAPATLRVTTTGSDGSQLTGACYTLDDSDEVCDVDGDGVINFEGVAPGALTLSQTTPPAGYQEVEDQEVTVEIGQSLVEVGVVNQAATGTVAVEIEDDEGEALNGVCAAVDGGEPVCDGAANDAIADEIGLIGIADVAAGEHEVSLTTVPEDYQLPAESELVTVETDDTADVSFTVATAEPATGALEMTVVTADDEPVPGACIVLSSGGEEVASYCDGGEDDSSGDEGVILVEEVAVGTYSVSLSAESQEEIEGFQSASTATVQIEAEDTATDQLVVVIVVEPTTGIVEVVTRAVDSGDLLSGACYELRGASDPVVLCDGDDNDEDGTDGVIRRVEVAVGTYTLVQTTTPDDYEPAPNRDGVEVNAGATTRVEVDLQVEEQTGTLVVEKVDPNGALLGDACFEVRQNGEAIAAVCDAADETPNDGVLTFLPLAAGDYRLVETKAPSRDYRPADARTVSINAGEETRVEVVNEPRPGRVEIITVDASDPDERLENACYELQGARGYGPYCDDDDLSVDGQVVFESVAPAEYTVVETVAPPDYERAENRTITVSPGGLVEITVQNAATPPPPEQGRLIVYKQDGQRQELPGGCFRLYDGDRSVSGEVCDNDDGANDATIVFDEAPVGTWMLRETLAPSPNYQIGDPVEVTIDDNETTEVSVVNQLKRGRILVRKTNPQGYALQGACFDLAQDEGGERCTDATGRVSFDGLAPGVYELTETRAPYGYQAVAPRDDVRVEPGQTTVLDLVDQIVEPEPDTGSIQVQKFVCPAGEEGERTVFLGGAEGNAELKNTADCRKGNAEFTLEGEDGGGPGTFATGEDGQYQVTLPAANYTLTETAPDLPGSSDVGVAVEVNQLTTVIVINYVAPPAPEPATIEVVKYTCAPGFDGTVYDDFAQNCATDDRLTNNITVRANGPENARGVTGDGGQRGRATLSDLPAGTYSVYEERPYTIPTSYGFCGFDADYPADYKTVNGAIEVTLQQGATLTCAFFNIPEELTETTGTILVRKYVCDVNDPPVDYDWYEECRLSDESARFALNTYVVEGDRYDPYTTGTANPDGLLRFPRLQPGTYQLKEIGSNWCHAESNSVNSRGDVVVSANQLSEVWIFNCVDTKSPPNTGAGPNAGLPGGSDAPAVLLGIGWPLVALVAWQWRRNRSAEAA